MTERGRRAVERTPERFVVGPSEVFWDGDDLVVRVDERGAPIPRAVRGEIRVKPSYLSETPHALDPAGLHTWWPIASHARIEVRMCEPALAWDGVGYLDSNFGRTGLEHGFAYWTWSRAPLPDGGAAVLYDILRRDGSEEVIALRIRRDGTHEPFDPPPRVELSQGFWRVRRSSRAEPGGCRIVRTLEDTPFYTRSELETHLLGERVPSVHESLDLDRFASPVVKLMLPFRMPRLPGGKRR
jgi:carotenoid 1,2-hydratase